MKFKFLFLFFMMASGCNISRDQQPMVLDPPETQLKAEDLDFRAVSKFVFIPSCVGCHKTGGASGGVNLETYESVFKHVPRIKLEVAGGLMPPGKPLNQLQVQLLNKWIDAGAKEHAGSIPPNPPTVPTPEEIPFATVMEKVFQVTCTGCHSADAGNMGGINLETYDSIFESKVKIEAAVTEGRMPPPDMGLTLTKEQKNLLMGWLAQGAKP